MNKTSDQDGFGLRWHDLWAFVPMAVFTLFATISTARQNTIAQHATVTQTNAGVHSLTAKDEPDILKHLAP